MGLAATAARLLTNYGEAVVLSYVVGRDVDGATGQVINAGTPTTITAYGYPSRYHAKDIDGKNILADDIRLPLEQVATRPQVGWRALLDGKTYRVMDVQPVRRSAVDIIYICQLRRQ